MAYDVAMKSEHQHYVVGYGSLLSHDSRKRYSNLDIIPIHVNLHGWQRQWQVNSLTENQTYVGVQSKINASLNAALIPTNSIDDKLRQRESNYEFVQVQEDHIEILGQATRDIRSNLDGCKLWICKPKANDHPSEAFPVNQSYVDTCLAGALESGLKGYAETFVRNTLGWHHHWVNDRQNPQYPRAAAICDNTLARIDALLDKCEILQFRIED